MKKLSLLLIMVLMMSALPAIGWAGSPWTTETTQHDKMMGKLGYGMKNLLLGWTEIIKRPIQGAKDEQFIGFGKGLGIGLYNGVMDTVGGALHVVTFPVTGLDIPLPGGGVECHKK